MTKITAKDIFRHLSLFIITFYTVTLTGAGMYTAAVLPQELLELDAISLFTHWEFIKTGLPFSIPFMTILLAHEMGHYIVARRRKVDTSLPFFIPFFPYILGTMGAVIAMRGQRNTRRDYFDIGIAGPLAGWVIAIGVMWYGYATLPPVEEVVFPIHPEYEQYGPDFADYAYEQDSVASDSLNFQMYFGSNLTMKIMEATIANPDRVPPYQEIMHYPFIMAGFWALFFTALNLLPIGQLDGGHILYGLVGARRQRVISAAIYLGFIFYAGLGFVHPYMPFSELAWRLPMALFFLWFVFRGLEFSPLNRLMAALAVIAAQYLVTFFNPDIVGFQGWILFALLLGRMIGIYHPPAPIDQPLSRGRQILGWISLIIFILSFTPQPVWMP